MLAFLEKTFRVYFKNRRDRLRKQYVNELAENRLAHHRLTEPYKKVKKYDGLFRSTATERRRICVLIHFNQCEFERLLKQLKELQE